MDWANIQRKHCCHIVVSIHYLISKTEVCLYLSATHKVTIIDHIHTK